jgi:hypothetical protein
MLRAWVPALLNIVLTATTLVLVYAVVLQLGYSNAIGLIVSLLVGFTTPLWVCAKQDFSEPLQTLLLLVAFWSLIRAKPPVSSRAPFWTGLALALLILTKSTYVILGPTLLVALLWRLRTTTIRSVLIVSLSFGLTAMAGAFLYLAWNYVRFGSPYEFGYEEGFDTPLLVGLYGWFFSSGKSVFLYAPLLILLLWAIPHFARRHSFETITVTTLTVPLVVLNSMYWGWHSDWAWALRYAVPLLPLWLLPIATVLESGRKTWRSAVVVLGALGLFVQGLGIAINPANYLNIHTFQITPLSHPGQGPDMNQSGLDVHFVPEFSPLAGHWWLLKATIERMRSPGKNPSEYVILHTYPWAGRTERQSWKPEHPEYALGPDLWMFYNLSYMNSLRIRALFCLSAALGMIGLALIVVGPSVQTRFREVCGKNMVV